MATRARLPVLVVLTITLAAAVSCGTCPSAPSITSLSPSATAGGNQFLLTINGKEFRRDSVVSWNNSFRVTTFTSSRRLVATVTATDIAQPGTVLVFVFNAPEGGTTFVSGGIGLISTTACSGKSSNAVSFTINP
ncbi:MAG: hypothetical protein DMG96_08395 [Acidobacteria bacterium]|nr:MAG: hypothetical protein DMG96_08395 [Acidobacteriota bacterium]